MHISRSVVFVVFVVLAFCVAAPLAAQEASEQPITRYALDLRAALPKVPADDNLAKPYGLAGNNLPGTGLGIDVGAHVYPLRLKWVTFGIGASAVAGRAHASPTTGADGSVLGKDVSARFSAFSPQISFNFGSKAGWSYLSGGLGWARLELRTPDTPADAVWPRRKTINYGGGGRWWLRDHMAATFDIRFYAINPVSGCPSVQDCGVPNPTYQSPRLRMLVISFGLSFR